MSKEIVRKPLKEQVRDILLSKIISGELAPGDRLKIVPIATALKVSQAPVREALQSLVANGYLEQIPNFGARVVAYSGKELQDIFQLRRVLEIASLSESKVGALQLVNVLAKHLEGMSQAAISENYQDYIVHDTKFHRSIVESSENQRIVEVWDSLLVPRNVVMAIRGRGLCLKDVLFLHEKLIERLTQNDIKGAIQSLEHHYEFLKS